MITQAVDLEVGGVSRLCCPSCNATFMASPGCSSSTDMLPRLPGGAADGSSADALSPSRPGTPSGLLPKVSSRPATASVPMSSQPKTPELPTLSVEDGGIFQDLADPGTNTEANILVINPLADAEPAAHEHEKQLADPCRAGRACVDVGHAVRWFPRCCLCQYIKM